MWDLLSHYQRVEELVFDVAGEISEDHYLDKMYCDCDIVNVRFWLTVVCEIIILTVCTSAQSEQNMPIVVQNSKCCL